MKNLICIAMVALVTTFSGSGLWAAQKKACCSCKCAKNCSAETCKKSDCHCSCRK